MYDRICKVVKRLAPERADARDSLDLQLAVGPLAQGVDSAGILSVAAPALELLFL